MLKQTFKIGALAISLRPVDWSADEAFLAGLMTALKAEEAAAAGVTLPREALLPFAADQSRLQTLDYRRRFPHLVAAVILADGAPVGRVYLDEGMFENRIVDITLAPQKRGMGIGGAVLRWVVDEADRTGRTVALTVRGGNIGARRLYERLGFVEIGGSAEDREMKKKPGAVGDDARNRST